jgi:protein SCO1/2/putative membrane protein
VASFFFTRCATGCPQMIGGSLEELQKKYAGKDDPILVSFTVDPEHDDPSILQAFANSHGADPRRWWFLTGAQDEMHRLIRDRFMLAVHPNEGAARTPGNEFTHSTRLVLIDRLGRIRGFFEGRPLDDKGHPIGQLQELNEAIERLNEEGRAPLAHLLPTFNAVLNAICGMLIVLGYTAVKARRVAAHKMFMLAALGISALFLASYLYYHIIVKKGEPTPFTREGMPRTVYFTILFSHTVLAAVVAPLALFTAYQGVRGRIHRHVRLARWTLPIWLYVSVTGVLVYWMLYQM